MLHLNKKNTWWSSDQQYKHTGWKRQTMHTPDRYGLKFCEKLTHCAGAEGHVGQCDCFWRSHIWYTPVHPIKLVHLWKILVHPGVYDTPGRQALYERKLIQQYSRTRGLLQLRKRYQLFRLRSGIGWCSGFIQVNALPGWHASAASVVGFGTKVSGNDRQVVEYTQHFKQPNRGELF